MNPGVRSRVAVVADELGTARGLAPLATADSIVQVSTLGGRIRTASPEAGTTPVLDAAQREQALAGEVSFTATVNGDRSRVLATTAAAGGDQVLVVVGTGTDVSDAAVQRAVSALVLAGPPAVMLAGAGAWLLAGATLRPVERMRRQVAEISDQDLGRRLAVPPTRDEIAALGTTMNGLLARLQEALERERGFVADAGHELRTPLAILRTQLELAARPGRSRDELAEAVAVLVARVTSFWIPVGRSGGCGGASYRLATAASSSSRPQSPHQDVATTCGCVQGPNGQFLLAVPTVGVA